MTRKFSVAVLPSISIIEEVALMKSELAKQIDFFRSRNSSAHITICEFFADERELETWKRYIQQFCNTEFPFEVHFVKTGSYPNGAFYLAPDDVSKENLASLLKRFNRTLPLKSTIKSTDPHMSIARQLSEDKMQIATEMFSKRDYNLSFTCTDIVLRQFNDPPKQFFIHSRYAFLKQEPLTLFNQL